MMSISQATASREINLGPDKRSPAVARAFVRSTLREWGYVGLIDEVVLAVSEIVTNAVVHAASPSSLVIVDYEGVLHVRLRDDDVEAPVLRHSDVDSTNGRGMVLVDGLAERWGVERASEGKVVWLDITKR